MWVLLIIGGAALATLAAKKQEKCPVTGSVLSESQLADPSLKVGGRTMCCKSCVKTYLDQQRAL